MSQNPRFLKPSVFVSQVSKRDSRFNAEPVTPLDRDAKCVCEQDGNSPPFLRQNSRTPLDQQR
jgi:hypothetical protein